jgi:hypothetical protein
MTATQHPPVHTTDYSAFPEHILPADEPMYRAHATNRGAWWYDNGPGGRFNLHGARGTCCTATSIDTAVREKVRDAASADQVVDRSYAESFTVSVVTAPLPHRCAAVSSTPAAGFGIVRELVTMEDYSVPQAWAEAFDARGFDGVFYGSAYTTGDASAYALFAPAGAPPVGTTYTAAFHLSGPDACAAAGMKVSGPPPSRSLSLIT